METPFEIGAEVTPESQVKRNDWSIIVDKLEQLQDGHGIEVKMDSQVYTAAHPSIRNGAMRRGFNVSFRKYPGGYRIYRRNEVKMKPKRLERAEEFLRRNLNGETLQEIGETVGISRQAVEYQIKAVELFTSLPIGQGRALARDEFLQPYLEAVGDVRGCYLCKEDIPEDKKRTLIFCQKCAGVLKIRALVACRIRAWKKNPEKRHFAAIATQFIRKYDVQPEDIKGL